MWGAKSHRREPVVWGLPDFVAADWSHLGGPPYRVTAAYQQYVLGLKLIRWPRRLITHREVVQRVCEWYQGNFFHAYENSEKGEFYGWDTYGNNTMDVTVRATYDERIVGCQNMAVLIEGMLTSLNIPASYYRLTGHGVVYLPTFTGFIHGDPICLRNAMPPGMALWRMDEIEPGLTEREGEVVWNWDRLLRDERGWSPPLFVQLKRRSYRRELYIEGYPDSFWPPEERCLPGDERVTVQMAQIEEQFRDFDPQLDPETCELTSASVPIQTLAELSY